MGFGVQGRSLSIFERQQSRACVLCLSWQADEWWRCSCRRGRICGTWRVWLGLGLAVLGVQARVVGWWGQKAPAGNFAGSREPADPRAESCDGVGSVGACLLCGLSLPARLCARLSGQAGRLGESPPYSIARNLMCIQGYASQVFARAIRHLWLKPFAPSRPQVPRFLNPARKLDWSNVEQGRGKGRLFKDRSPTPHLNTCLVFWFVILFQ